MYKSELKERLLRCCALGVQQREAVEKIADEISSKKIENIFFAGSGGSITTLTAFAYLIKKYSSLPSYAEEAAELLVADYKQLTQNSLVVIMAKTGTMIETVSLSKYCQDHGIPTLGFVAIDNTPVANQVDYKILINEEDSATRYIPMYTFVFRLLYNRGEFDEYPQMMKDMENLGSALTEVTDQFDEKAQKFAEDYADESFQLYICSGANIGEVLKYSADIGEELFRHKTQMMHSSEFFHGCLEIVDDEVPVILVMSEDESRVLDERVARFVKKYASKKLTVIDPMEYELNGLSRELRKLYTPIVINLCLTEMVNHYMKLKTGLSAATRRYYGVVDY